jgi:hypothetical protein
MGELSFATIDFDAFHRVDLPARIAGGNGVLAAADIAGVGPIAFRIPDGSAYTYVAAADTVEIVPGDETAQTVVELSADAFSDFANELRTAFGLLYASMLQVTRGEYDWLVRWEPALRALYHGRPIIDPASMGLRADLDRTFAVDDSDDDLRAFLQEVGFLHVRGVFTPAEIDGLRAEVERMKVLARPDDGRSWWATQADGTDVCCRLIYLGLGSELVADLGADARLARFAALGAPGLVPEIDCIDGQSVVIKNPDIKAGLSDLPWHRDCGLGGHPAMCPSVAIGIQLDAASAETGQLYFLAGSHRGSSHPLRPGDEANQPVIAVDTQPGDVTVHFGDILHAAPPPTGSGPGRRALYVTFTRPETQAFVGVGNGYNDVLFERDGRVHSVEELV